MSVCNFDTIASYAPVDPLPYLGIDFHRLTTIIGINAGFGSLTPNVLHKSVTNIQLCEKIYAKDS